MFAAQFASVPSDEKLKRCELGRKRAGIEVEVERSVGSFNGGSINGDEICYWGGRGQ
jgi:hypothetical protein